MMTKKMTKAKERDEYVFPYEKIKIPFRERRDKVRWPENKILAVKINVAQECWHPTMGTLSLSLSTLSQAQGYNFDVAIWRVFDLLDKYSLKVTFLLSGAGARYYPEVLREIKQRGHEIAAHGYWQSVDSGKMGPEAVREDIVKTTAILESVCGERPRGWLGVASECTEKTFEILAEQDYLWHGDLRDDDLPYGINVKGKILVEIPHRVLTTNDFTWFSLGLTGPIKALRSPREAVEFFKDTFDGYYQTAKREGAQSLTFGIHSFLSGIPDRIGAIEKMIEYMKGFPDVWFTATYANLAQWWKENYLKGY